jgi:hypothetical protein
MPMCFRFCLYEKFELRAYSVSVYYICVHVTTWLCNTTVALWIRTFNKWIVCSIIKYEVIVLLNLHNKVKDIHMSCSLISTMQPKLPLVKLIFGILWSSLLKFQVLMTYNIIIVIVTYLLFFSWSMTSIKKVESESIDMFIFWDAFRDGVVIWARKRTGHLLFRQEHREAEVLYMMNLSAAKPIPYCLLNFSSLCFSLCC